MKKGSFFKRLTGSLSFNEDEEMLDGAHPKAKEESAPKRDVPVISSDGERLSAPADEEVGELPVDVYETANEIIIQTLISGVTPDHLTINITRDMVTITGKREENKHISDDSYHVRELYWGSFGRQVALPVEVDIDEAEAIERHGMLIIKLPKIDKARKAALKVKSI